MTRHLAKKKSTWSVDAHYHSFIRKIKLQIECVYLFADRWLRVYLSLKNKLTAALTWVSLNQNNLVNTVPSTRWHSNSHLNGFHSLNWNIWNIWNIKLLLILIIFNKCYADSKQIISLIAGFGLTQRMELFSQNKTIFI